MYLTDAVSGETLFSLNLSTQARRVTLEGFNDFRQLQIPMQRKKGQWTARLTLSAGWFFYHFKVDGKTRRDRGMGKCKTADGSPYSLALIQGKTT